MTISVLQSLAFDARIAEEFDKRCPFKLTMDNLLVLAHVGSKSHGTYVPPDDPEAIDDIDYMGVVIPPVEYVLGVEQWEGVNFMRDELDVVFYSLEKFVRLLMKNNPNVLGMLWMRMEDYIVVHPEYSHILANRDAFSSLLAYHSFLGYANSQLTKMTAFDEKTTKEWDSAVATVLEAGWAVDDITDKSASLPMPDYAKLDDFLFKVSQGLAQPMTTENWNEVLGQAKTTIQKLHARHFQGYMGEKRKALVRKYGYDTKNAAHLIRLMRMCCEFMETGKLQMHRAKLDSLQLKAIKSGKWRLDKVQATAKDLFDMAHHLKANSKLPELPDRVTINALMVDLQRRVYSVNE